MKKGVIGRREGKKKKDKEIERKRENENEITTNYVLSLVLSQQQERITRV